MRTIQEVGKEILSNNPASFYVFIGPEYGVKEKYIKLLEQHYDNKVEAEKVSDILNLMKTKHLIPLKPTLYVVRYDEQFISDLSSATETIIKNAKIVGTIVCIYEQSNHTTKINKYLDNFTVHIDTVSSQFVNKYLHGDFPKLCDNLINVAVKYCDNYSQARNMCRSMSTVPAQKLLSLSDNEIANMLGRVTLSSEKQLRKGIASRNFAYLVTILNNYSEDVDTIFYSIMSTLLDLEKLIKNKYTESDLREYIDRWTLKDIYYMFMNTYEELKRSRSNSYNIENGIIYLLSLLKFKEIPSPESLAI